MYIVSNYSLFDYYGVGVRVKKISVDMAKKPLRSAN